ncbi:alpha-soluble NSF attachment [Olea europaea subsp. europaea]|uniref:Alpha-soluble NSF attachment n=1 Tax=Olea europaea subsp. europaea TaxID=158383 RepID=A0A8S0RLW5_OLEEU|nr:alpha-soluble NSF attachment [Olea europaea subsp. europaea]
MGDHIVRGEDFVQKSEKKLSGWGLFGSKYEDAADLFEKAANAFKLGKSWDQAGAVYVKLADSHLKEIAELYEQEQNLEQAIVYYEKACDLFQSEEVTTSANQCKQKIAQFAAQLERYQKAVEIYEEIVRQSLNNNLLKYGVKGHLLNAGICQLCKSDVVAINNALERYEELDPTFSGTREYKLLADLAAAVDEEDVAKFTDAIKEFDSMTQLDAWKTTLLLRVKEALKAKELEEDDLT